MRALRLRVLIVVPLAGAASGAQGEGSVTVGGSLELTPSGSPEAFKEVGFESLGMPLVAGTALRIAWSANGGAGPPVEFGIHHHLTTGGLSSTSRGPPRR